MIKYKVFVPDTSGKITFTKTELENLLNEVYHEGYTDGQMSNMSNMSNMVNIKYGDTPIFRYDNITCDADIAATLKYSTPITDNTTLNKTTTTTTTIGD